MGLREWFGFGGGAVDEAAKPTTALCGPANVERAGFEFGIGPSGLTEYNAGVGDSTQTDRRAFLQQLYDSYLACPWAWACTQAISKTITGGPLVFDWDTDTGDGDQNEPTKPDNVRACERLLRYTNEREDIRQLMRSTIADLCVFGDAYIEVVWLGGVPVALYTLDAPSMYPIADPHGAVTGYVQITDYQQRAEFDPHEVIHISLDSPRSGLFGVSPMQAALLPITSWLFAAATLKETHRKGGPLNLHVDLPQGMAQPEVNRWLHQYMANNVGPRNLGRPVVTKGGATVHELGFRKVDELLHTLDQKRDEICSAFGVPPALVGVIESGNIGSGSGESQRKIFAVNVCQPLAALLLEKLDFHLVKRGFSITGWHLKFAEVDMRDSKVIEDIRDQRVRNGAWVLNKYRTEIGETPVEGGDTAVLVDRQNLVLWRDMDAFSKSLVAKNTKGTTVGLDDPGDSDTPVALVKLAQDAGQVGVKAPDDGLSGDDEDPAAKVDPPGDDNGANTPPGESYQGRPARPLREDWRAFYRQRLAEALRELPGDGGDGHTD